MSASTIRDFPICLDQVQGLLPRPCAAFWQRKIAPILEKPCPNDSANLPAEHGNWYNDLLMNTINSRTSDKQQGKATHRRRLNLCVENYWTGGLERFYFDLINGLPAEQFEITLFANPINGLGERLQSFVHRPIKWVPYHNLTTSQLDYRLLRLNPPQFGAVLAFACRNIARWPLHLSSQRTWRHLWQQYPAEVLHIVNGGYPGAQGCLTAALAARAAGCPRILMSVLSYPFPLKRQQESSLDQQILAAVDCLIPNSVAAGQGLVSLRHFPADRVTPIQGGTAAPPVDREAGQRLRQELGLPAQSLLIGTVAVLEPLKGHLVLLDAVRRLQSEFPHAHFIFVGDGRLRPQLEAYLQAHQLADRVSLLGYRKDVPQIINAFDVVAFPSLHEGLPYAIQEAMALAKPIVASRVGGIPEEIDDGRSGLLVPPGDSQALADGLRQLLRSPMQAAEMGRGAQEKYARQFTLGRMVEGFIQLYCRGERPC
jgi:glycosyltransferase involved in cell wall biosynthesis